MLARLLTGLFLLCFSFSLVAQNPPEEEEQEELTQIAEPDAKVLTDLIEGQLKAITAHDINRAYYSYGSADFLKTITYGDFRRLVSRYSVLYDNQAFKFDRKNSNASIVSVYGSLTSRSGDSLEVEYDFVHENGEWKILGFQLYTTKPKETQKRKH